MANSLNRSKRNAALALAVTAILAACSGDGGGNNRVTPTPVTSDTLGITTANRLISFSRITGATQSAIAITGLMGTDTIIGFDIRPADNSLVALANSGRIYTINPTSGAATLLSTIGANAIAFVTSATNVGVDFNPVPDRLRITTNAGKNLRVNVATGVTIVDGDLTLNGTPAMGVVGAGYNNKFAGACRTQLFYLDVAGNRLLTTTAPNDGIVSVVGAFGVTASASNTGFEFFTAADGSNTASVVLTVGGVPMVFSLNPATGAVTAGAPIGGLNAGENIAGISATPPATVTQVAGELTGLTSANAIFTFNSAAPNKVCTGPTNVTGLGTGENVVGIDVRPAISDPATNLYGVGVTPGAMGAPGAGRVFQINRTTGAISAAQNIVTIPVAPATMGTAIGITGTTFGVDFNPVPDRLRIVSDMGQNLRVNVTDGTTNVDGVINSIPVPGGPTVPGGNVTAAAYTNSFGPTAPGTTTLYTIDSSTVSGGQLNIQNPPNNGTQMALPMPLGITGGISGVSGFDINGVNNVAIAALQVTGSTATGLYGINLATGAATQYAGGNVGAGTGTTPLISGTLVGMTFTNNPQVTAVGVTATGNQLVNFSTTSNLGVAANLATFTTTAITGLQGGENVIGADFRTSTTAALNNRLYVATDQARTYVVDPATGAATQQIMLVANAGDPFTGFMGTSFGVDFNPAADRLRTTGGTANIRSVLDGVAGMTAGTTFTDTPLNRLAPLVMPLPPQILAAAYSNSTPGTAPTSTTLFTLDAVNNMLFVQNPPNAGSQVAVGPLGVDAISFGGFDITGPNTALAVINTVGLLNGLYSINLANGAATLIGAVAAAGVAPITGLALPVSATDPTVGTTATAVVGGTNLGQFITTPAGLTNFVAAIAITGLVGAETIVDIDIRPGSATAPVVTNGVPAPNGQLFGFGSQGRLYSIGLNSGVATAVPLVPAAGGTFMGVTGTNFGIDFNPVPNLLRVVSDMNQNLRINVGTGETQQDTNVALSPPVAVNSVASAYTNAFPLPAPVVPVVPPAMAPVATTTLYDLDLGTNTLQLQNPPNMGVLTQVGRLDPSFTFTPVAAFDIVGGENGLVLAVLQRTGAAQSSLYRINLATGQATLIGDIGPSVMPTLVGSLALRLR